MNPIVRWGSLVFALLFAFSMSLQFNDPNPAPWVAMYGASAITCLFAYRQRLSWRLPAALGGIASGWAATYLKRVWEHGHWDRMFEHWHMTNDQVVADREMFGLLIVIAWMVVLVIATRRKATTESAPGD